jgi:hypothetical protein
VAVSEPALHKDVTNTINYQYLFVHKSIIP